VLFHRHCSEADTTQHMLDKTVSCTTANRERRRRIWSSVRERKGKAAARPPKGIYCTQGAATVSRAPSLPARSRTPLGATPTKRLVAPQGEPPPARSDTPRVGENWECSCQSGDANFAICSLTLFGLMCYCIQYYAILLIRGGPGRPGLVMELSDSGKRR